MSAAFLDYDNDGRLDIYAGNMWTAAGQRITAAPGFKPDAPPEIRAIYRRHARGNSLFRNRGDGTFEDVTLEARAEFGRWAWSSDAFDFDNDGWEDLYVVNGMFTRDERRAAGRRRQLLLATSRRRSRRSSAARHAVRRRLARDEPVARERRSAGAARTQRAAAQRRARRLRRGIGSVGLDLDQDGRSFALLDYDGDGDSDVVLMAPRSSPQLRLVPQRLRGRPCARWRFD